METKLKVIIIEDEQPARELLKAYLKPYNNIELIGEFEDGFSGIKGISSLNPDLILLDIQMPKLTGFEMLELLDEIPEIIFTTAYDQYALKAFEVNAIDYLMKPFSKDRFDSAIQKVIERKAKKSHEANPVNRLKDQLKEEPIVNDRIFVKTGNHIDMVHLEEILFIEAQDDYIEFHTAKGKFLKKETMRNIENQLNGKHFIRVHRSFIINTKQIQKLEKYGKESYMVILKDGTSINASRSRVKSLKEKLGI